MEIDEAQAAVLRSLKTRGLSDAQIALRLGVHQTTVSRWRRELNIGRGKRLSRLAGMRERIEALQAAGCGTARMAAELGVSASTLRRYLGQKR
jgi:predicted transcriptional regulator